MPPAVLSPEPPAVPPASPAALFTKDAAPAPPAGTVTVSVAPRIDAGKLCHDMAPPAPPPPPQQTVDAAPLRPDPPPPPGPIRNTWTRSATLFLVHVPFAV